MLKFSTLAAGLAAIALTLFAGITVPTIAEARCFNLEGVGRVCTQQRPRHIRPQTRRQHGFASGAERRRTQGGGSSSVREVHHSEQWQGRCYKDSRGCICVTGDCPRKFAKQ